MRHRFLVPRLWAAVLTAWAMCAPAAADELTALARPDIGGSGVTDRGKGLVLTLDLSQPVPYRVYTLDAPPRLVTDFREVDWGGADAAELIATDRVRAARAGAVRPGWSRLVLELDGPYALHSAEMPRIPATGRARLTVRLRPTDRESFAAAAPKPAAALRGLPEAEPLPPPPRRQDGCGPCGWCSTRAMAASIPAPSARACARRT